MVDVDIYLKEVSQFVDAALDNVLPSAEVEPKTIHEAMRYSLFAGGKRMRPALCLAAAEACGGAQEAAINAACAVELIHTYSLVHDDLPCMDDDDLRRGRPTCHKVYGEGMAVLCGDALLTEAFLVLAQANPSEAYSMKDMLEELAFASGSRQLIGGQVMDLEGEGKSLNINQLEKIHLSKTAALLTSSLVLGAMSVNARPEELAALRAFGKAVGLAFQIQDDILDLTQPSEVLGKTAGKDIAVAKSTYPALIGLEESKQLAQELTHHALSSLSIFGDKASKLESLAHFLLKRNF